MNSSGQFFIIKKAEFELDPMKINQIGGKDKEVTSRLKPWNSFDVLKENLQENMAKAIQEDLYTYRLDIFSKPWKIEEEGLIYNHLAGTSKDGKFKEKMIEITNFEDAEFKEALVKKEGFHKCNQIDCIGTDFKGTEEEKFPECCHVLVKYEDVPQAIQKSLQMRSGFQYLAFVWACNKCNPGQKCAGIFENESKSYRYYHKIGLLNEKIHHDRAEMPVGNHVVFTCLCVKKPGKCFYPQEMLQKLIKERVEVNKKTKESKDKNQKFDLISKIKLFPLPTHNFKL